MKKSQEEKIDKILATLRKMLINKGHDYSTEDTLAIFKSMNDVGMPAHVNIMVFMNSKMFRLKNLLKAKEVRNESIEDTLLDLANYCILYALLLEEEKDGMR